MRLVVFLMRNLPNRHRPDPSPRDQNDGGRTSAPNRLPVILVIISGEKGSPGVMFSQPIHARVSFRKLGAAGAQRFSQPRTSCHSPVESLPDGVPPEGKTRGLNREVAMSRGSKAVYTILNYHQRGRGLAGRRGVQSNLSNSWATPVNPHRTRRM